LKRAADRDLQKLQNELEFTIMALSEEDSPLPVVLAGGWTRETIEQLARELGVIKRARKKDVWVLL
jgi:hypothetical protein